MNLYFQVGLCGPEKASIRSYSVNYSLCHQFLTDKGI